VFATTGDREIVVSQGDPADVVFYIQRGTVKLTAVSARRKKAIIAFLQRGIFGGRLPGRAISADLHGEAHLDTTFFMSAPSEQVWSIPLPVCASCDLKRFVPSAI
jgi:hypothetical protein